MKNINIAMVSGNKTVKPLVSAFKTNGNSYVILDNQTNGTMGLPIILVSKLDNTGLNKIMDQGEWGLVKEMLRNIIAGGQVEYIDITDNLNSSDMFYSQLTLPVASFDALKNNYRPVTMVQPQAPVQPGVGMQPQITNNLDNIASVNPFKPSIEPQTFVQPAVPEPPVQPGIMQQQVVEPTRPVEPAMPPMPDFNSVQTEMPRPMQDAPQPQVSVQPKINYAVEKEEFLKACENMFDALISKLNK